MNVRFFQGGDHRLALIEDETGRTKLTFGVHFLPTPPTIVSRMLRLAAVSPSDTVYDLGCGDGRIVIECAKTYGARAAGFDYDQRLIQQAIENAEVANVGSLVRFERCDLFDVSLCEASVVTLFLSPTINSALRPKLLRELRPGSRVVSHLSPIGDWQPDKTEIVEGCGCGKALCAVYLWNIPNRQPASAADRI
jgi:SAM-dependent methyltransferase